MLLIRTSTLALLILFVSSIAAPPAFSQAEQSSFVRAEMGRIKTQATGRGFTSDSLRTISVNSARAQVGVLGVGSGVNVVSSLKDSPSLPQRNAASFNSFGSLSSSSKPFAQATSRPTVSPYLNLFRESLDDNTDNYNTLVRPQLQQQQLNQSFERQTQAITRRVQSLAAKPAFNPQGSTATSPTGHPTGFMYYSHYYPGANQGRR